MRSARRHGPTRSADERPVTGREAEPATKRRPRRAAPRPEASADGQPAETPEPRRNRKKPAAQDTDGAGSPAEAA